MRLLWHFISRDFRDFILGWVFVIALTVALVAAPLGYGSIVKSIWYVYGYFLFYMFYGNQIWNTLFGIAIAREYLHSLPVSRSKMFWIMMCRSSVGALPLAVYAVFNFEKVRWILSLDRVKASGYTLLPKWEVVLLVLGMFLFLSSLVLLSFNFQQVWKTMVGRYARMFFYLRYLGMFCLDIGMLLLWMYSFLGKFPGSVPWITACVSLLYVAIKWRIAYIQWFWGPNARVFNRLLPIIGSTPEISALPPANS